jgi:hypothetical protein
MAVLAMIAAPSFTAFERSEMDIEIGAEAKDKSFNRRVAITVVALSIFMGLCGVKDGNIVQAMQQAQSDGVDAWNEYQATKTKLHIDETAVVQAGCWPCPATRRRRRRSRRDRPAAGRDRQVQDRGPGA